MYNARGSHASRSTRRRRSASCKEAFFRGSYSFMNKFCINFPTTLSCLLEFYNLDDIAYGRQFRIKQFCLHAFAVRNILSEDKCCDDMTNDFSSKQENEFRRSSVSRYLFCRIGEKK